MFSWRLVVFVGLLLLINSLVFIHFTYCVLTLCVKSVWFCEFADLLGCCVWLIFVVLF